MAEHVDASTCMQYKDWKVRQWKDEIKKLEKYIDSCMKLPASLDGNNFLKTFHGLPTDNEEKERMKEELSNFTKTYGGRSGERSKSGRAPSTLAPNSTDVAPGAYGGSTSVDRRSPTQSGGGTDQLRQMQTKIDQLKRELDDKNNRLLEEIEKGSVLENKVISEEKKNHRFIDEMKVKDQRLQSLERQANDNVKEVISLRDELAKQNNHWRARLADVESEKDKWKHGYEDLRGKHHANNRSFQEEMVKLTRERDDLRDRFSKLAGAKLMDNNADIADLSDPNRAMKLSEKFGQVYDDEWTDAFQELTDKRKMQPAEVIQLLLKWLQECSAFCQNIANKQLERLKSVLLHPSDTDSSRPIPNQAGLHQPRVTTKDDKALQEVRRQVGNSVGNEVKQHFVAEMLKNAQYQKLASTPTCKAYLEKCAEICWMMILREPVLYLDMNVNPGERLDTSKYSVYSSTGDKIQFLVWPPLYNGKGGGLLSKGVAATQKRITKS